MINLEISDRVTIKEILKYGYVDQHPITAILLSIDRTMDKIFYYALNLNQKDTISFYYDKIFEKYFIKDKFFLKVEVMISKSK